MNQKVIYSTLLSPAETWVEKKERDGEWEVLHTLADSAYPQSVFLKQRGGVFKTGIRKRRTLVSLHVTHNIDAITQAEHTHTP